MDNDPSIGLRLYEFGWALLPYWWLLVPGGIFAIEPMLESFLRQGWKEALDLWWPKETRHRHFRYASVVALFVGAFLAFDDLNIKTRATHKTDQVALNAALSERDEARRQLSDRGNSGANSKQIQDLQASLATTEKRLREIEKAPRRGRIFTNDDDAIAFKNKLMKYAGSKFWIVTETNDYDPNSEQMRFSRQLKTILNAAGWVEADRLSTNPILSLPLYARVTDTGVLVNYSSNDPKNKELADFVVSEFSSNGIDSFAAPFSDMVSNAIIFYVGLR